MRKIKYYIGSLLLAATVFCACQDDFDNPGLIAPVADIEANTSISDLKTMFWNENAVENSVVEYTDKVNDDYLNYIAQVGLNDAGERIVISGRVISSDRTGNIYKNLVIQDETGALTLSINQSGLYNNYRVGQEIVVDVTDMHIGKYNGLLQLGAPENTEQYGWQASFMPFALFQQHSQLNGLPDQASVDTITVSIPQVNAANATSEGLLKWQSQLIRLNNVRFEDGKGELCYTDGHEISSNRTLYDENGNSIIVRNSGYATFWSDKLPSGYGDVVGILSYYGTSGWQILIRSTDDCMNFGNPTIEPGKEDNPYTVSQAIAKEQAEASATGWVTGYIVGAVAPEVETITSNEDIEWGAPATLKNTLVIAASADVKEISECLVFSLPQDSKLREYGNLVDNPENLGKQIWLIGALEKYMGTWGITGNRGTVSEFRIEGVEISDGSIPAGNGTETSPYNVSQVQGGTAGTGVWVCGYIVGWVDGMTLATGATFGVPATSQTNLLIANTPTATSVDECIPVQLPTSIRGALNLQDNPSNLGKKLYIKGNLVKYFGTNGVKEATEYKLEGEGSGTTPETPANPVTTLDETFEGVSSIGQLAGWTSKVVAGNKAWYFTSFDNNYYAACTAYKGTDDGNGYDSWLITPPLNVDGMTSKTLSFDSQAAYSGGSFEVYAMTTADPATATLTKLNCTLATPPSSGYSGFISSGDISLSNFSGVIYIGFRYIAETSASSMTFCIDNVKAGIGSGSTPDTPEEPVTPPATGDNVADFNTFNNGTAKSSPYATYTTAAGWTAENSIILGGSDDATEANNPYFGFIGAAGTLAPTLNGKTTASGKLTSPTLTGGIKTLSFNYGFAYSDTKCSITINVKQNGSVVKSVTLDVTEITKQTAYDYSVDLNVDGDFVIEIVNNCVSASSSNKDRISIWNLSWTN